MTAVNETFVMQQNRTRIIPENRMRQVVKYGGMSAD